VIFSPDKGTKEKKPLRLDKRRKKKREEGGGGGVRSCVRYTQGRGGNGQECPKKIRADCSGRESMEATHPPNEQGKGGHESGKKEALLSKSPFSRGEGEKEGSFGVLPTCPHRKRRETTRRKRYHRTQPRKRRKKEETEIVLTKEIRSCV